MALNINGTTGISGVDGSASAPAVTGTDSNTGINFASDTVNINTGGVTRATVDSAGALGVTGTTSISGNTSVGTTSQNWRFQVFGGRSTFTDTTAYALGIRRNSVQDGDHNFWIGGAAANDDTNPDLTFSDNGGNEKFRFTQGGNLFVGTTGLTPNPGVTCLGAGTIGIGNNAGVNTQSFIEFRRSGTQIGSVTQSGTTGVAFNTSSDYRLKENVTAISDGITRLKTLKPSRFNFKVDKDTTVDGFLAHEVTAVPEAITGEKDAVDSNNDPIIQQIDQSKLVPLLTAALQEAVAKIEVLETKVAALEAA